MCPCAASATDDCSTAQSMPFSGDCVVDEGMRWRPETQGLLPSCCLADKTQKQEVRKQPGAAIRGRPLPLSLPQAACNRQRVRRHSLAHAASTYCTKPSVCHHPATEVCNRLNGSGHMASLHTMQAWYVHGLLSGAHWPSACMVATATHGQQQDVLHHSAPSTMLGTPPALYCSGAQHLGGVRSALLQL